MRREEQNWRSQRQIRADFKVGVYVSKDSRHETAFATLKQWNVRASKSFGNEGRRLQ